jgi:hypothetical protein
MGAPLVRKGRRREADISIVGWMDLLGYGSQIEAAGLNPLDPQAVEARQRLLRFTEIVKRHSSRLFPSLVINDGAAFFRNLSFRGTANTVAFINAMVRAHYAVKNADKIGARTIVSVGFRDKTFVGRMDELKAIANNFVLKVHRGEKTLDEIVLDALATSSSFNQVPALNSNYAFTKSFIADEYGKRGGFSGSDIFIESGIFSDALPENYIKNRVSTTILSRAYEYLNVRRMKLASENVLDTIVIARYLATDDAIFEKLFGASESQ